MAAGVGIVTREDAQTTFVALMRDYGFATVVAVACGWVLRADVLLPLVEEHRAFVKQLGETQREISRAVSEQTRLLYALQREKAALPPGE
jgi:hypothetical protein